MKNIIQKYFDIVAANKEYIEENSDYTEVYDYLVGDESVYHSEQWESAIIEACAGYELSDDEIEMLGNAILENLNYYCDIAVHVQGFPHSASSLTCCSFAMGEEEILVNDNFNSSFADGIVEYLNKHCPNNGFYKVVGEYLYCYLDYSYSYVGYELKPENVVECLETYRNEQQED